MLNYALVTVAGLGALLGAGLLVRFALIRSERSGLSSMAIGVYAFAALAGAIKFCFDLVAQRTFWNDDSTAVAFLNFVGILIINFYSLLPVVVGCGLLYLASRSGTISKSEP